MPKPSILKKISALLLGLITFSIVGYSQTPVTIYDIQYVPNPAVSDVSSYIGQQVEVTGKVTNVSPIGYFINDGDTAWSDLWVSDVINTPTRGMEVTVVGTVDELGFHTTLRAVTSYTPTGNTLPVNDHPVGLATSWSYNEKYESQSFTTTTPYYCSSDLGMTSPADQWYTFLNGGYNINFQQFNLQYDPVLGASYMYSGNLMNFDGPGSNQSASSWEVALAEITPVFTIRDNIQYVPNPTVNDTSLSLGNQVQFAGIVTAVRPASLGGIPSFIVIQQNDTNGWSGVKINDVNIPVTEIGNFWEVYGQITEVDGNTEIHGTAGNSWGLSIPANSIEPKVLSVDSAKNEIWESILVTIPNLEAVASDSGMWTGVYMGDSIQITDLIYASTVNLEMVYEVTGILYEDNGEYKLAPRSGSDIVLTKGAELNWNFTKGLCASDTLFFTDNTVYTNVTVTDWYWDFGDGSTSSLQNPSHVYSIDPLNDTIMTVSFAITTTSGMMFDFDSVLTVDGCGANVDEYGMETTVVGITTYDKQSMFSSKNRITNHGNGTLSTIWQASSETSPYLDKGTGYSFFDGIYWSNDNNRIETVSTSTPSYGVTQAGKELITNETPLRLINRSTLGSGSWVEQNMASQSETNFDIATSGDNVYVVGVTPGGTPYNGVNRALLYRKSNNGGQSWQIQDQQITNSPSYISVFPDGYDIDANGQNVAIAVFAPVTPVKVFISTDYGNSFIERTVRNFGSGVAYNPDGNILDTTLSAQSSGHVHIDGNGVVHVVFKTIEILDNEPAIGDDQLWYYHESPTGLNYWNSTMSDGADVELWLPEEVQDGIPVGNDGGAGDILNRIIGYPTIGEDTNGNLFLTYESLSGTEYDPANDHRYAKVYISKSADGGNTWTLPINVTRTQAYKDCTVPSSAKLVDDYIHIQYLRNDETIESVSSGAPETPSEVVYLKVDKCFFDLEVVTVNEFDTILGSVNAVAEGGVLPYQYVWSNGSTDKMVTGLSAGIHDVTVTDAMGCLITATSEVFTCNTLPLNLYTLTQFDDGEVVNMLHSSTYDLDLPVGYESLLFEGNDTLSDVLVVSGSVEPFDTVVFGGQSYIENVVITAVDSGGCSSVDTFKIRWNDCSNGGVTAFLDVNNASVMITNSGNNFSTGQSFGTYEAPKGSGKSLMFSGALWVGGKNQDGELKIAATMSKDLDGSDYYPGPVAEGYPHNSGNMDCAVFDQLWKINKTMIDSFIAGQYTVVPSIIVNWPAKNNPNFPETAGLDLAPFVDVNSDGAYNPIVDGDYPNIKGDQAIWSIMNDANGYHYGSNGGQGIGMEVHTLAYAFTDGTQQGIDNITYYEYTLINKSDQTITDTYVGYYADVDVGTWSDDYIGCDTTRNLGIGYNGDDYDENTYGTTIPMVGVSMINEPKNAQGEKVKMTSFMYLNRDATSPYRLPTTPEQFYGVMQSTFMDGTHLVSGGTGHVSSGGTDSVDFMFPSDPSDPLGWSECAEGNSPGDRSFLMSHGPITLFPGTPSSFTTAVMFVEDVDYSSGCPSFDEIQALADTAKLHYEENICNSFAATANVVKPSCFNLDDGIVEGTISGGAQPYFYEWSTGDSISDVGGLADGLYIVTMSDANGCVAVDSVVLNRLDEMIITDTLINPLCYGETGTITLTVYGSASPYTYAWNGSSFSASDTATYMNTAGVYVVTVSDVMECQYTSSLTISSPDELIITGNIIDADCGSSNGEITATVTGGVTPYQYVWSNGGQSETITGLAAGEQGLAVYDDNGCSANIVFQVSNINSQIVTGTVTDISCFGEPNGEINVSITSGVPPYFAIWSTGQVTQNVTGLSAGSYDLQITDSDGCITFNNFIVNQPEDLKIGVFSDNASCGNDDGSASVTATGGVSPYSYFWSNGMTTDLITNVAANAYYIVVIDANGCSETDVVGINEDSAPMTDVDTIIGVTCAGDDGLVNLNVSGGSTPYSFLWSNGETTQNITGLTVGNYEVTISDMSSCNSYAGAVVGNRIIPSDPICLVTVDSILGTNLIVWEKQVNLGIAKYNIYRESSVPGTYQLIGSELFNNESYFVDSIANPAVKAWRYKIAMEDSCGVETELSDHHKTVHLTMNLGVAQDVNLIWDHYEGFAFDKYYINRYTDTQGWELIDSVANNSTSFTDVTPPLANSIYYAIEVKKEGGCISTYKASSHKTSRSNVPNSIVSPSGDFPAPTPEFYANLTVIEEGDSISFFDLSTNDPDEWDWTFNGGIPDTSTSQNPSNIRYDVQGVYTVILTSSNAGGSNTEMKVDYITVAPHVSGINNNTNPNVFRVYPSPSDGYMNLFYDAFEGGDVSIVITNSLGEIVSQKEVGVSTGKSIFKLDLHQEASGVYFVKLVSNVGTYQQAVIID